MKVTGLDHLVINVTDMDSALTFYGGVLGLEILRLAEFRLREVGFVSVRVSEVTIMDLWPTDDPGYMIPAPTPFVSYQVGLVA